MEHYLLNGYEMNYIGGYPSVKLYGVFDTLNDALSFLSSYIMQKCEHYEGGNTHITGNGYRLWIRKIMNNNDLYVNNGIEMLSGGNNVKIRIAPDIEIIEYNNDELTPF
tara:strand:- start:299 stop:625 length:327 start_codon:yes stop_codon:yes gene_type:complete